jgi:DNA-binding transcriptional LysR family regulator
MLSAMSKFTLRQLEIFRAIARAGSISGAGALLHLSRSSVTAGLDDLERVLGRTLCTRTKASGIELTAAGEEVLDAAEDLLARADSLEQLGRGAEPSGLVTVGCFPSLAPTVMAGAWAETLEHYPEVELNVVSTARGNIVEMLKTGQIDYGLAYNLQTDPALDCEVLYDTEMHVILGATHPLAEERVVRAENLAPYPLILMDVDPSVADIMRYFDDCGVVPNILT